MNFSDFGTNNSHVVWHKYKEFLIDSIAKLKLFNCIILFGDHHKSNNNNSFKIWQIFGPSKPPICSLYFIISSAEEKRNKNGVILVEKSLSFKKLGQHWSHPHCRDVAQQRFQGRQSRNLGVISHEISAQPWNLCGQPGCSVVLREKRLQ